MKPETLLVLAALLLALVLSDLRETRLPQPLAAEGIGARAGLWPGAKGKTTWEGGLAGLPLFLTVHLLHGVDGGRH